MNHKTNLALLTLALAAAASTAFAQAVLWSDNFDDNNLMGWMKGQTGQMSETNQQFVVSGNLGPFQPANPLATHVAAYHAIPTSGSLPDHQTLEMRADLTTASQNGAFAGLHFLWRPLPEAYGYLFFKGEDEVALIKFWNGATSFAWFFDNTNQLKNQNVTLVLALTREGANLNINARVLDKDNADAVLFDHTVTDTPQADPVVSPPGRTAMPDFAGTPWPMTAAPGDIELTLQWVGPESTFAQVTYDNVEVRQYESPQLTIQKAAVLSWSVPETPFVLVSAPSLDGPWTTVSNPWCRTNAGQVEVSIVAPDSQKFFQLRQ